MCVRFIGLSCPAGTVANANWPATIAGEQATGTCLTGFSGTPSRSCSAAGVWSATQNDCVAVIPSCPQDFNYQNAIWPATAPGGVATGACRVGFTSDSPPQRQCIRYDNNRTSSWSVNVQNPCYFVEGVIGTDVFNVTEYGTTATSITLAWNSSASFICISISIDGGASFFPSSTWPYA